MDIRRPMRDYDKVMLSWAQSRHLAVHILLNKSDKLNRGKASTSLLKARKELKHYTNPVSIQMFSAFKGEGVDILRGKLDDWLYPEKAQITTENERKD
jgi:GTP-binding protein